MATLLEMEMDACNQQAIWSQDSIYEWEDYPTISKSKYKETCVTYNACVLQRIGILSSGQYIWHNTNGDVYGANDKMVVSYPNQMLHDLRSQLQAGDILMDGDKTDLALGSHIFIITGDWSGNNPLVWDNHSAQQRLGAYAYTRNRNVFALVRLTGNIYNPRLDSSGMNGSPYWYSRNPFYLAGFGLPNCTCYAWGRFWEIADPNHQYLNRPTLSTSDAENWYNFTADGYERGSTPQLGAVACWADGPFSGAGHVAIVEQINSDNSIVTSNSAYGGQYFYTQTLQPPFYLPAAGYVFQGFIYNPYANAGGGPAPYPPGWWFKPWMYKKWLWKREQELIR